MMKYGKKLGKRITAFLMILVMTMTIVMSVEPMEVRAATTHTEQVIFSDVRVDDIFKSGATIKNTSTVYNITVYVNGRTWTISKDNGTFSVSNIFSALSLSDLHTLRCSEFSSKSLNLEVVNPPKATVTTKPTAAASLVYDGSDKSLLATGGTATNGTMCYRVRTTASAPADSEFTITDTNALTEKNAGTYYVWYMAKGNTGYVNSSKAYIEVQIARATPTSPTTPTLSDSVPYGTKLSQISLGNDNSWIWENGNITPNAGTTEYTVIYNKTLDTANYDWSTVEGYDSTSSKIKRTVSVTVTPVEKTDATFTVPTNLSKAYDAAKTLKELIPFSDNNWAWTDSDGAEIPQVSDTKFTAKYTVPSPDDTNYTWDKVTGYKTENDKIIIERELPVTISAAAQTATVSMEDYDFGGTVSTPQIKGVKESATVTYYYNTVNSNQGGTRWENMTSDTLDKGTYYMYAVLSETANYAAYTTPAVSFKVNAKTMTGITAAPIDVTYDGKEHRVTVSGCPTGATVYYGTSEDNCNSTDIPKYTNRQAETTIYFKVTAKGYNDYTGFTTVKISPKVAELRWDATEFTYNGSVQTPSATVSNLYENDICTVTVEGGQKDYRAAAYTATATALSNSNYILPVEESDKQINFSIAKKEIGVNWTNTQFTYDRTSHKPAATLTGVVPGDDCSVTVSGEQTDAGTDYTATASVDNANYKIKTAEETTIFTISPKTITESMISLDQTDKNYVVTGGTITPVVTVKDGAAILTAGEDKEYVLSGQTDHAQYGTYTITVTGKGNYTGSVDVKWNITDPYAPSGTIAIESKTWGSFPASTAFGYFFKEAQQVRIRATDGSQESGVDKVYYCKSPTALITTEQLADVTWTEIENGGAITINPNANVFIYAKITDNAGNATYLASDGMVVYTDAAQVTESISFTKTAKADVTADVALNGNTIKEIMLGDTTLVEDRDYTISEDGGVITFRASFLQTLAASDTAYTLTVSYNPGGKTFVEAAGNVRPLDTTIALTVNKAEGSLTNISDSSKTYDGLAAAEPTFDTTNDKGTNNGNVTFAYKKKGAADSTYTEEKPVDAGTYIVKITVAADDNYNEVSNTAEFTISKAEISVSAADYDDVYDGTAHGIKVDVTGMTDAYTVSYGVMPEEEGAQITYGETPVTYRDAGTYIVYYKVSSENYNDKFGSAKVTISPKTIGISWKNVSFVYDGEEHMPTATATGLEGEDECDITVTGAKLHAGTGYVAEATAVSNPNYQLPQDVKTNFAIVPADITLTAADASKHIGKNDPEFTYQVTTGALIGGDSLSDIALSREDGETAGDYVITVAQQSGSNPDYNITFVPGTFTIEDHVVVVDAAVAPTCTETGLSEGTHCSLCDEELVAQVITAALGHDWSGDWKVTRVETATEDGRRELTCKRDGCGHKKYESIPAAGIEETEDPNAGELEKYTDVAADSPIVEAALGNKKSELIGAAGIFTAEEKEEIRTGTDAKVWLEIAKAYEGSMPAEAKAKMLEAARQIMGDDLEIVFFELGLNKQIGGGSVQAIHEPGIGIRITVEIPEQLLNHDKTILREYKILRLHNGTVTVLGTTFHESTGEITFETDRFSTYAIVYSDTKKAPETAAPSDSEVTGKNTKSPKTGDNAEAVYWAILMLISFAAAAGLYCKKKEY